MIKPFNVACLQTVIHEVRDASTKAEVIRENVNRALSLIDYVTGRFGSAKLCLLPEFSLQGFDHLPSLEESLGVCVELPGPEIAPFQEAAAKKGIFIAGNAFEVHQDWPNRWFNTAFLIDPRGEIALRYRKINTGSVVGNACNTSPGDVYSEYVARYGHDALFPVADTDLGRIGMLVCYDICFPEISRALAMKGAEILLHPTGEPYGAHRDSWECAKRARAFENVVYLASANHGAYYCQLPNGKWTNDAGLIFQERVESEIAPSMRSHGSSEVLGFDGKVIARADGPGEAVIQATLDVEALRYRRSQTGMNFLAQLSPEVFAPVYASAQGRPVDSWLREPIKHRSQGPTVSRETIKRLQDRGIFVPPAEAVGAER